MMSSEVSTLSAARASELDRLQSSISAQRELIDRLAERLVLVSHSRQPNDQVQIAGDSRPHITTLVDEFERNTGMLRDIFDSLAI